MLTYKQNFNRTKSENKKDEFYIADTFTIRISKDTPAFDEMDKAAEQLGLSRKSKSSFD